MIAIVDETWRGIIIWSIPATASWLPVIPSLYMLTSSADIVFTLLAHGMILDRQNQGKPSSNSSNTVLAARVGSECTNLNCKVKKCLTHTLANCYWPGGGKEGQFPPNFRQRAKANTVNVSHSDDHFVLSVTVDVEPGVSGVIIDDETTETPIIVNVELGVSGVIVEDEAETPTTFISHRFGSFQQGKIPTFLDSGASDTIFVSRDDFIKYVPITS